MSSSNLLPELRLKIADFVIGLTTNGTKGRMENYSCHQKFLVKEGKKDIDVKVHYGNVPQDGFGEKVFESDSVWSLYRKDDSCTISLCSPVCGSGSYKVLTMNSGFSSGDVYIRERDSKKRLPYPLDYPLDELLMINFLPLNQGMALHACGVIYQGKGIIFCGSPNAGKSTMANLWKAEKDTVVLNDERLVVRKKGDDFWVYGTPWQGDAKTASPQGALLKTVFFIEHASENYIVCLKKKDVFSSLFTRSFTTYWDSRGTEGALELCSQLVKKVPGFSLGFVPDRSAVDFVAMLLGGGPSSRKKRSDGEED